MCGIVGAVSQRDVAPLLLEGLRCLEYRGYDSAGIAVCGDPPALRRLRRAGPVRELAAAMQTVDLRGRTGIAHTRWATHGAPTEANAHPHTSAGRVAVVHNGIIENADALRQKLQIHGYRFESQTDTEVVAHLIELKLHQYPDAQDAIRAALSELQGQFALAIMLATQPGNLFAARRGCPLILAQSTGENFVASDAAALVPYSRDLLDLEDGELAVISSERINIFDNTGTRVRRNMRTSSLRSNAVALNGYRHFMQKEIFEQPDAIRRTLKNRITPSGLATNVFDEATLRLLKNTRAVHFVACGTSYHAAMIARYMTERLARLPCSVEHASEYRYRNPVVQSGTLLVTVSQSGETADTLAALRMAKTNQEHNYCGTLSICNVPDSTLARESDAVFMTDAGPEIGVASTKAFTTQLAALSCITLGLARLYSPHAFDEAGLCSELASLPVLLAKTLALEPQVKEIAALLAKRRNALFIARGTQYPIAMEAALKLKEISYIHAEAYPAGELKHGPLALVDHAMPVIALAPMDPLHDKVRSNIQEVAARGGELIVLSDEDVVFDGVDDNHKLTIPRRGGSLLDPYLYTVPLQLLAYHTAVLLGTDVDKPRNLAKSVTVE